MSRIPKLFARIRRSLALAAPLLPLAGGFAEPAAFAQPAAVSQGPAEQRVEPDPFYTGLMRDGRTALLRGDAAAARRDLRLACFGFLDFPALLAECRIRLGLAEGALGDRDAFTESFSRLEEIESRFQVYAAAGVSPEERAAFEERALEWISPEVLRTIPAFAPLVERSKELDFAKLSPRDRTRELERRAAADPKDPAPRLMLAEEELARGRSKAALERLAGVADSAGDGAAGCLRGRALAELDRCGDAVAPLGACAAVPSDPRLAELAFGCLLGRSRLAEAEALAGRLTPAVAKSPEVRKQLSRLEEELRKTAARDARAEKAAPRPQAPPATRPDDKAKAPSATPKSEPAAKAVAGSSQEETAKAPAPKADSKSPGRSTGKLSAAEEAIVEEARAAAKGAQKRDELERALDRLRPVADRHEKDAPLQALVGELAYRASRWKTGAEYLVRPGGRPPSDPTLRFYLAVCQFEAGDEKAAARTAGSGLEKLPRTPFVDAYLERILGGK